MAHLEISRSSFSSRITIRDAETGKTETVAGVPAGPRYHRTLDQFDENVDVASHIFVRFASEQLRG